MLDMAFRKFGRDMLVFEMRALTLALIQIACSMASLTLTLWYQEMQIHTRYFWSEEVSSVPSRANQLSRLWQYFI